MSRRRKARELVFSVLFQLEHGQESASASLEELVAARRPGEETVAYARDLLRAVLANTEEIDGRIAGALEHWTMERLAATDRNVMRLAVGELIGFPLTPAVVIISEAVELAQRYGTERSGAFVNGILDRLARRLRPGELRPSSHPA